MDTSLTPQRIELTVDNVISMASMMVGIKDGGITPAIIQYSKLKLQTILAGMLNKGLPLWAVKRTVVGLNKDQIEYPLSNTVYNILNAQWRMTNVIEYVATGGTDPAFLMQRQDYYAYAETTDYFQLLFLGQAAYSLGTLGLFFFGEQTVTLTIEGTIDYGLTWELIEQVPTATYSDGAWVWLEYNKPQLYNGVRISIPTGETLRLRHAYPANLTNCTELPMSQMNRDDYSAYPMKYQYQQPLLYYFNKQKNPLFTLWGKPINYYDWQCVLRVENQMAAPDILSGRIDVPIWAQDVVVKLLAVELCYLMPGATKEMIPSLKEEARQAQMEAQCANTDRAPVNVYTKIRGYTR